MVLPFDCASWSSSYVLPCAGVCDDDSAKLLIFTWPLALLLLRGSPSIGFGGPSGVWVVVMCFLGVLLLIVYMLMCSNFLRPAAEQELCDLLLLRFCSGVMS